MSTIYFSHGYAPEDRRFNEHIWKLLRAQQFDAWIDTGLDGGWDGNRLPMDVSFNEWMLSRCAGFVAVCPRRESEYQALEYRLAIRTGLPSLVLIQEGGTLGSISAEAQVFPSAWSKFWQRSTQERIEAAIKAFSEAVSRQERAVREKAIARAWRPNRSGGDLKIALLQPTGSEAQWMDAQRLLQQDADIGCNLFIAENYRHAQELVLGLSGQFDLLVLDVGPHGTPREMLGYIEAQGIPQVRVCMLKNQDEVASLGKYLASRTLGGRPRLPYQRADDGLTLPRFLDGLKLDSGMEPVRFWTTAAELAGRVREVVRRIETFRSGLSPDEGGSRVELWEIGETRRYFSRRYEQTERGNVFLSFAGKGDAIHLADRLSSIIRFIDCRCFHYRDPDSTAEGRLESGELVNEGLELRVNEADIFIMLLDSPYLESRYCSDELKLAKQLHDQGELAILAYATDETLHAEDLENINVFVHKGGWSDETLEQLIIKDVDDTLKRLQSHLLENERKTLKCWLEQVGLTTGEDAKRSLVREGVGEADLKGYDWSRENWLDLLLRVPNEDALRRRARERFALFLLAVSEEDSDRRKQVILWINRHRLVALVPKLVMQMEDLLEVDPRLALAGSEENPIEVGQKLNGHIPGLLKGTRPIALQAEPPSLKAPLEWTRENPQSEPAGLRRPIRWQFTNATTRKCLFEELSKGGLPPRVLLIAIDGENINPQSEIRELGSVFRNRYHKERWPTELVRTSACANVSDLTGCLQNSREEVVHIAGHMSSKGLHSGAEILGAADLASSLSDSNVRLLVLNGCKGGTESSPLAFAYATLVERVVLDGRVPEVVAHRGLLQDRDGLMFAVGFYSEFLQHFDASRAAFKARKMGSESLRLSPVVVSQRSVSAS